MTKCRLTKAQAILLWQLALFGDHGDPKGSVDRTYRPLMGLMQKGLVYRKRKGPGREDWYHTTAAGRRWCR